MTTKNTFSGLFKSYLRVVHQVVSHCYRTQQANFCVSFQLERLINGLWNQNIALNFALWEGKIWAIFWLKNTFYGLCKSCLGVVQQVFKHCYRTYTTHFWVYFQLERLINCLWNQIFGLNFPTYFYILILYALRKVCSGVIVR